MAALGMPRRGKVNLGECRQRAVHVGRGEIVWQDRCDAANGSKEPRPDSLYFRCVRSQDFPRRGAVEFRAALQLKERFSVCG